MDDTNEDTFYCLVTGANSGLGFAICCRLIDEFLLTRPQSQTLHLIITTRDLRKSDDTLHRLRQHLQKALRNADKRLPGISMLLEPRVRFQGELVDLTSLLSVHALGQRLRASTPKLDALILNAGMGGFTGVNWPNAFYTLFTDWVHSVTWPTSKKSGVGWVTKPQLPSSRRKTPTASGLTANGVSKTSSVNSVELEPPLGEIFCANVFGHYMLAHHLVPLLSAHPFSATSRGRIIWLSSLEAYAHAFDLSDIQGVKSSSAYESSKRLTDILALTSHLPATAPWTNPFLCIPASLNMNAENDTTKPDAGLQTAESHKPSIYVAHPGICATDIMPLPYLLTLLMNFALYVARWLGSPWHTISPYTGACAPVWLAISPQPLLDDMETGQGKGKWGSATDARGRERVTRTEVEGWGWGGAVEDEKIVGKRKGRWRGAKALTAETRTEFEELGRAVWKEMEGLRGIWEERLEASALGKSMEEEM